MVTLYILILTLKLDDRIIALEEEIKRYRETFDLMSKSQLSPKSRDGRIIKPIRGGGLNEGDNEKYISPVKVANSVDSPVTKLNKAT